MNPLPSLLLTGALALLLALAGCGPQTGASGSPASASTPASPPPDLDALFLSSEPQGALPLASAMPSLQPGDPVVLSGQIGGTKKPFTEGFAAFILADTSLQFCDEMGSDHCPTPWDACCEDPARLRASRASVQFLAADGQPLPHSLAGVHGLAGLDHVTVVGQVAPASTPDNLQINATALFRRP